MVRTLFFLYFLCGVQCVSAQNETGKVKDVSTIIFKDTLSNLAFDSSTTRLYAMQKGQYRLVKYFKYVGDSAVVITKAWTNDPHYICDYPTEPLIPGKVYAFSTCFSFFPGQFQKRMGFNLSNGEVITLIYKGSVLPSP